MALDQVQISGSIRRRLTVQLVLSAAGLASVLFVAVWAFAQNVAQGSQDTILRASATSILEAVSVQSGEVTVDIPYAALSMLGNISDDRVFYRVAADDMVLTGYDDLPPAGALKQPAQPVFATRSYKGDAVRLVTVARKISVAGGLHLVTVTVAQTRNGQAEILSAILRVVAALGIGFFILSALLGIWAAQSSLRPLQHLALSVARRGPKDLRPVPGPVPQEMAPLVHSLNQFISRLRVSLARSEDFIAEAAHRVRTPLATVRTQAELVLRRVEQPENRSSMKEMIRAIDESSRAAGQLLDHAMVSFRTDHLEREEIAVTDLVEELVDRLRPVAGLKDIELTVTGDRSQKIDGDAILIQNAVRNLLDNAIKYGPEDSAIEVYVLARQSGEQRGVEICVCDEAGGFPDSDLEQLSKRFTRGANAAGTVGSGLGLTIAREVAEAHGGHLAVAANEKGNGSCVSLCFPGS